MAFPVTLNGRTYTLADFEGNNYVDGLPDAFEDFVTQAGNIYTTTSTSSVAIGTGSKTFTVADSGKPYIVGTPLRIADTAAPSTNWIDGIVTAYSGTTLTVNAIAYAGSGTKTAWSINIGGGPIAYTGTLPVAQGGTGATTAADARTNLDVYSKSEADGRYINVTGDGMTSDLTFGDNVKATFGAGSDLQIYHDGSNSYITDAGTGDLVIRANNLRMQNATGTAQYILADDGGAVQVRYNGSNKLATTSTGVDVTGTVTADGLTVDGIVDVSGGALVTGNWNVTAKFQDAAESKGLYLGYNGSNSNAIVAAVQAGAGIEYWTYSGGWGERMRIDGSGNVLVGKTSSIDTTTGFNLSSSNYLGITRDSGPPLYLNRLTSIGSIVELAAGNTLAGTIGVVAMPGNGEVYIAGNGTNSAGWLCANGNNLLPMRNAVLSDNIIDIGANSYRMDDIYATNGTIQTSDRNEKQDIEELSEAERRVAVAAKGLIRKYRWIDSVQEKGDDARIHIGIIAQDLQAAFEAEGLDAGRYAMFISSTWWEKERVIPAVEAQDAVYEDVVIPAVLDDEGNEIEPETTETRLISEAVEGQEERTVIDTFETAEEAPEGATERTRLGVRYPELLAFIIGAL